MARLISVQIGQPVTYPGQGPDGRAIRTAIGKKPVAGCVWLGTLGLEGDAQANLHHHGGPFRAINVYPGEHYPLWRELPGLNGMTGGAFGENFTIQGLLEDEACVGDTFRVGEAVVQITQPRSPCGTLNIVWQRDDLMARAEQSGRIGWYMSVVHEGHVQAGDLMERLEHPYPHWSIARIWNLHLNPMDQDALHEMLDCPCLSESWKSRVRSKLQV